MKKTIGITLTLLILLICLTSVNAEDVNIEDVNLTDNNLTNLEINDTLTETVNHSHLQLSSISDSPVKAATINAPGGTFSQLQSIINSASSGDTISITGDYTYNSGFSIRGITINKNINIVGNNHIINGLNTARIFNITAGNVYISDLNFINGYSSPNFYYDGGGGAISVGNPYNIINTINLVIDNCSFDNNGGNSFANVINGFTFNNFTIKNCDFYTSYVGSNMGESVKHAMLSFYVDGEHVGNYLNIINNTFHKNNDTANLIYIDRVDNEIIIQGNIFDTVDAVSNRLIIKLTRSHNVNVNYNVFLDGGLNPTTAIIYNASHSNPPYSNTGILSFDNNWWGNNSPNFNVLIASATGVPITPETWAIMHFTNLEPINSTGGSSELISGVYTCYNRTSDSYSQLLESIPERQIVYTTTSGSLSSLEGNDTTLTYSPSLSYLKVTATIDNQVLNIGTCDIDVNIEVTNDEPTLMEQFKYRVIVSNNGPDDARDVVVNINIPSNLTYVNDNGGGKYNATTGIWNIGDLNNGDVKTLNITVQVPYNQTLTDKEYWAYANVTGSYADFNTINNNNTINVTVRNLSGGSYIVLQNLIDNTPDGGVLNLFFNVTYNATYDYPLLRGMIINKSITINGNGYAINGLNTARIFNITAGNVYISNLNFINGYAPHNGYY